MTDNGNPYRTKFPEPDWHQVAEQAAQEQDPKKLAHLIQALCDRLEELQRLAKAAKADPTIEAVPERN